MKYLTKVAITFVIFNIIIAQSDISSFSNQDQVKQTEINFHFFLDFDKQL
jgi:hypothetical protein